MVNNTNMLDLQRDFSAFVSFLYAVLVALVIETAYSISYFESIFPVLFTLILLSFFAYDWMSRSLGYSKSSENLNDKSYQYLFFVLLLEISIVYFLLLFSLKFVELYAPLNWKTKSKLLEDFSCVYSCCWMALFAVLSGAWNALMIGISTKVNKPHICNLFKGHLDRVIVEMFPELIKKWRDNSRSERDEILAKMTKLKEKGSFKPDQTNKGYRKKWRKLDRDLDVFRYFKSLVKKPHYVLFPYLLAFHVVALNFALGFLILLSALFWEGKSLSAHMLSLYNLYLPTWVLAVGVLLSWLFLIFHSADCKDEATFKERIGCIVLFTSIIYGYFLCSAATLMLIVVFQQVIANIIMNEYYNPKSGDNPEANRIVTRNGRANA